MSSRLADRAAPDRAAPRLPAQSLRADLWPSRDKAVYAAIDGAAVPGLLQRLAAADIAGFDGLLRGALPAGKAEASPYLVGLREKAPFTDWLLGEAWQAHPNWGVLAQCELTLREAREHLRGLNQALLPDGRQCAFRWYDGRVLGPLLPSCGPEQLAAIFGPLDAIVLPGADGWSWFEVDGGVLLRREYAPAAAGASAQGG